MKKIIIAFLGFLLILGMWTGGASLVNRTRRDLSPDVRSRLYPGPAQVLSSIKDIPSSDIRANVLKSTLRVLIGFAAAAIIALPMGFVIGRVPLICQALEPANDFLRYLPVAGFSTLTIFLLGTGDLSAIAVVFMGTVFHLVVATADSVRRVPQSLLELGQTMGLNRFKRLVKIVVPASAPAMFDNLRVSIGWAWSYVTLAEIMGTESGLGHAIEVSRRYIRTDQVLFWIFLIGLLGLLSDQLMRAIGRVSFRWAY